jgi:hypothetical protein
MKFMTRAQLGPGQCVAQPEVEHVGVPPGGAVGVGRVEHHVREPDRDRLLLFDPSVGSRRDAGAYLHGAAVEVEEAQAVAAALGGKLLRFFRDLDVPLDQALGQRVYVVVGRGAERDQVQALGLVLAEPDDVALG